MAEPLLCGSVLRLMAEGCGDGLVEVVADEIAL
jgi:hypothetical protein